MDDTTTVPPRRRGYTRKRQKITPGFPLNDCEKQSRNQMSSLRIAGRSPFPTIRIASQTASPVLQVSASLPQLPAPILPSPGRAIYGCESSRTTPYGLAKPAPAPGFVFQNPEHRVNLGLLQHILQALAH